MSPKCDQCKKKTFVQTQIIVKSENWLGHFCGWLCLARYCRESITDQRTQTQLDALLVESRSSQ